LSAGSRVPEQLLTDTQRRFAEAVRACLSDARVSFSETIDGNQSESWYSFRIQAVTDALEVSVDIVDDQFTFGANGAHLIIARTAWDPGDVDEWIAESIECLRALLQNELRLRVRRTLLGGTTGAVWITRDGGKSGGWNGDLAAVRGKGEEKRFAWPWYQVSEAR
jgi:hypothetical protein